MEIEKKVDAVATAFEEFKKLNDKRLAEIDAKGQASGLTIEAVEKANKHIDELQAEVKKLQTAMSRPGAAGESGMSQEQAERKDAFNKYLRKGIESKALSVGSDPDGGFLVLPEMATEVVKKVFESSPMRQLASVQQISSDSFEMIEDLDEAASGWVNETASRAVTNTPQIKKIVIAVHELYAKPQASQKILDDAMFNVEAWLAGKIAEKFARDEATAFIGGNGVGKPRGILTYAAGTAFEQIEQINSGAAATLTGDGLIDLVAALKAPYKQGAAFMMKRSVVGTIRKLKGSTNDAYLWQPGLQASTPDLLLGFPIYEADDMAALGAGNLPVAFGNFKMGYQIVDRVGIRTLRDPFSSKPYVEFYTTKRVGGDVKNFEAIKLQKCST
jgi:HK97 family phage major capsid protein